MATTADISRGMILKLDGSLYSVVEFGQNKTARAAAKVWAKLKGPRKWPFYRSIPGTQAIPFSPVRVERKDYQFLYKDDSGYTFMDTETFEQVTLAESFVDAPTVSERWPGSIVADEYRNRNANERRAS